MSLLDREHALVPVMPILTAERGLYLSSHLSKDQRNRLLLFFASL